MKNKKCYMNLKNIIYKFMIKKFESFNKGIKVKKDFYDNGQKGYEKWSLNGKL